MSQTPRSATSTPPRAGTETPPPAVRRLHSDAALPPAPPSPSDHAPLPRSMSSLAAQPSPLLHPVLGSHTLQHVGAVSPLDMTRATSHPLVPGRRPHGSPASWVSERGNGSSADWHRRGSAADDDDRSVVTSLTVEHLGLPLLPPVPSPLDTAGAFELSLLTEREQMAEGERRWALLRKLFPSTHRSLVNSAKQQGAKLCRWADDVRAGRLPFETPPDARSVSWLKGAQLRSVTLSDAVGSRAVAFLHRCAALLSEHVAMRGGPDAPKDIVESATKALPSAQASAAAVVATTISAYGLEPVHEAPAVAEASHGRNPPPEIVPLKPPRRRNTPLWGNGATGANALSPGTVVHVEGDESVSGGTELVEMRPRVGSSGEEIQPRAGSPSASEEVRTSSAAAVGVVNRPSRTMSETRPPTMPGYESPGAPSPKLTPVKGGKTARPAAPMLPWLVLRAALDELECALLGDLSDLGVPPAPLSEGAVPPGDDTRPSKRLEASLYARVFAVEPHDTMGDDFLAGRAHMMRWLDAADVGVPEGARNPVVVATAAAELRAMCLSRTTHGKLSRMSRAIEVLARAVSLSRRAGKAGRRRAGEDQSLDASLAGEDDDLEMNNEPTADDLVPALSLALLRAGLQAPYSELLFIERFRDEDRMLGRAGWVLATAQVSLGWLARVTPEELGLTRDEFRRRATSRDASDIVSSSHS
jgi:hypothetical protein